MSTDSGATGLPRSDLRGSAWVNSLAIFMASRRTCESEH